MGWQSAQRNRKGGRHKSPLSWQRKPYRPPTVTELAQVPTDWLVRRACFGKRVYRTRKQALTSAATQSKLTDTHIHPYKYPHCREWHIGHV